MKKIPFGCLLHKEQQQLRREQIAPDTRRPWAQMGDWNTSERKDKKARHS
jgi:hypothetical protein